jgi:NAD-dependent DNA ligase
VRSEVVTLTVNAALAGVPVAQLVGYRQQLVNLGNLINQSLRASRGRVADVVAVERAADVISKLIQR